MKNGPCFTQKVLILFFSLKFEISASKLVPVPNFSQIGQKIREVEFRPENCLMTSYLPYDDDVSNIVMGLERFFCQAFSQAFAEYHLAKCGDNWTTNKRETEGTHCAPQLIFYQNTPA